MERIAAADASFLYLESEVVHLHVTGLLLLDPATAERKVTYRLLRAHVNSRLDVLSVLRRRLVEVPYAIDHPEWIDDPDFDLDRHFHRHRLPRPGTDDQLAEYLGGFASVQLDRAHPLWDFVVVEGLVKLLPTAEVGFLGMVRDETTFEPTTYAERLPDDLSDRQCFAIDPMLATGGSLAAAIQFLFDRGAKDVTAICLLGTPEGVAAIEAMAGDRDVTLVLGALDERLNEKGYIVPGLGDAGDRLYGTV